MISTTYVTKALSPVRVWQIIVANVHSKHSKTLVFLYRVILIVCGILFTEPGP